MACVIDLAQEGSTLLNEQTQQRLVDLVSYLRSLGSVAVAFSGGVDSTLLLKVAHDVLGSGAIAVTARSPIFPEHALNEARSFCHDEGISHITVDTDELSLSGFASNPANRCYLCKRNLLTAIREAASCEGIVHIAEGSNKDDEGDFRPGLAAVDELGVESPLRRAHLTKAQVRQIARALGLAVWDKPSSACLASRIPYGEVITRKKLSMVARAEWYLHGLGFGQLRVRLHAGGLARIEVSPGEFAQAIACHQQITAELKRLGFTYVALDLEGFRSGSMNEALTSTLTTSTPLS